jgi:hypothetical protein
MLTEAVEEVFSFLRPRRSEYKRNSEFEVPPKIILSHIVDTGWMGRFRVSYYRSQHLTALENVFSALDGRGSVSKSYYSALQQEIEKATRTERRFQTEYFEGTVHKNGNMHLTFRRLDLLKRLNEIAGGKRLRGERERR